MGQRITIHDLRARKEHHQPFAVLTAWDYPTSRLLDTAGIPVLLVGDSLAMTILGHQTTLPITLDEMLHHARAVARGATHALLVGDLPFMSYQLSPEQALQSSGRYLQEAGMSAVKCEGAGPTLASVRAITEAGIPVMGHLGLTPQSVHAQGGFHMQAKDEASAARLLDDAKSLEQAGAFSLVLESIPSALAQEVTQALSIPTIGIGSGPHTDAQVLVSADLLGLTQGPSPKFAPHYAELSAVITQAVQRWAADVSSGTFPPQ